MIAPILKGKKVILKPMEPKHAQARYKWYNDPKVARYQDFGSPSEEKLKQAIIKRRKSDDSLPLVIFTENNELIGEIQLREISHRHKSAKLGINIGETNFWNKGYATDAIKTLCKYYFNKLKYNRIGLSLLPNNIAAVKCYQRCGFKKEGISRKAFYSNGKFHDDLNMSLIKDDYKKIKITKIIWQNKLMKN